MLLFVILQQNGVSDDSCVREKEEQDFCLYLLLIKLTSS